VDINPDTLINYGTGYWSTYEDYFIDVNSDGQNDIQLRADHSNGPGGT
jgi:hypothetical protein